jgi:hypothetical protein
MSTDTLKWRVELVDKQAVINHYQPPAGKEDDLCRDYLGHIHQQIEFDLGVHFPLVSRSGDEIKGHLVDSLPPDIIETVKRQMRDARIPGIRITEVTETNTADVA